MTDVPNTAKEVRLVIDISYGSIGSVDVFYDYLPVVLNPVMCFFNSTSQFGYAEINISATSISIRSLGTGGVTYSLKDLYYR